MSYILESNFIHLDKTNGNTLSLRLTENSGRVVSRCKIDTITGVPHPGIELGVDQMGYRWIAHHHFKNTYPTIDREDTYGDGNYISYDDKPVYFSRYEILQRALSYWWSSPEYALFKDNCQHFVNIVVRDERYSESVEEISDGAALLGGIAFIAGLLTKNKAAVGIGAGLLVAGGAGKALNRTSNIPQLSFDEMFGLK